MSDGFLTGANAALFTDLYELTMAQAYLAEGMVEPATFSLYYRTLPEARNYVLSCGIEDVADFATELPWRTATCRLTTASSTGFAPSCRSFPTRCCWSTPTTRCRASIT